MPSNCCEDCMRSIPGWRKEQGRPRKTHEGRSKPEEKVGSLIFSSAHTRYSGRRRDSPPSSMRSNLGTQPLMVLRIRRRWNGSRRIDQILTAIHAEVRARRERHGLGLGGSQRRNVKAKCLDAASIEPTESFEPVKFNLACGSSTNKAHE